MYSGFAAMYFFEACARHWVRVKEDAAAVHFNTIEEGGRKARGGGGTNEGVRARDWARHRHLTLSFRTRRPTWAGSISAVLAPSSAGGISTLISPTCCFPSF